MTCWNGHVPHMTDDQVHQAVHAYMSQMNCNWQYAWQSPLNPLRDEPAEPRRRHAPTQPRLPEAKQGDKVDAIDVEFVRVR
jgi:hypothetical protein